MKYAWVFLLAAAAAADDVILVSGGELNHCTVVYEGPDEIVVKRGGTEMVFRRSQVLRIIRGQVEKAPLRETPSPPPAPAAPAEEEAAAPAAPAPPTEEKAVPPPPPRPRREAGRIKGLVDELASNDKEARQSARFALVALGKKAHPELAEALTDSRYWVRFYAARIFRELGARETTKALLEALYAAVPETGRCPSGTRPYVRAVRDALRASTGMSFGLSPRYQSQGAALKKWIEWWEKNYEGFPPQVGEEELDPAGEDYAEKLKEARKPELQKKTFPRPPTWQPTSSEY